MDKLTAIKIKYDDGTYSDEIPISVLAGNVEWDSVHTLVDVLGSIDVDVTGTIQDQISQLFNEKVSKGEMQTYVSNNLNTYITAWLNQNVDPVGSAVIVDNSLTISGAAADASVAGELKNAFNNIIISRSSFQQGSFTSAGGKGPSAYRIRLINPIQVKACTKISFEIEDQHLEHMIWLLSTSSTSGGNILAIQDWNREDYNCKTDGFIMIAFRRTEGEDQIKITPEDLLNSYYIKIDNLDIINNYILYNKITNENFISGSFNGSTGYNANNTRICLSTPIHVKKGTILKFSIEEDFHYMIWELASLNIQYPVLLSSQTWTSDQIYTVDNDCYIMVSIKKQSSLPISIDDFNECFINIEQPTYEEEYVFNKQIKFSALCKGGFDSSGKQSSINYLRLITPIYMSKGTKITFFINNLYYQIFELSSFSLSNPNILKQTDFLNTQEYSVQNDAYVMIVIAKKENNVFTQISLDDFKNCYISINDESFEQDFVLKQKINKKMIELGGFTSNGGKGDNETRIRLITPLYAEQGYKLHFSTGTLYHMVWEMSNDLTSGNNILTYDYWNQNSEYIIQNNCYIMIAFCKTVSAPTQPIFIEDFQDDYYVLLEKNNLIHLMGEYFNKNNNDLKAKIQEFCSLFKNATDIDSFLFFTDSHFMGEIQWQNNFYNAMSKIGSIYKTAPVDFCIFGGDVVTGSSTANTITADEAMYYLIYWDKYCRELFGNDNYFPIIGNHEWNYYNDDNKLTQNAINNAMFRKEGKAYYTCQQNHTCFYFMDTGINHDENGDYNVPMDDYKWEQIDWLGNDLISQDNEHNIIILHIIYNNQKPVEFPMFIQINDLCSAYNNKESYTIHNKTYNFQNCQGKVELFLGGHIHQDKLITRKNIPCVMRSNTQFNNVIPTFDLILCDWGSSKIYFKKIGDGSDLTINVE